MNVNKVFLAGRLTRDPELRYSAAGLAVVKLGLAVNRPVGKDSTRKEETCFVNLTAFGKTGEVIAKHLHKGDPLYVEGRLTFEQWESKTGEKRSALSVICDSFQFVGGKRDDAGSEAAATTDEANQVF